MSKSLCISFKPTCESFDVPYNSQTTIDDLIKYVCIQSSVLPNTNPNDYYLMINKSDMLRTNQTVEAAGLDQLDRIVSLDMCTKTRVLMKRIVDSRMQLWQDPIKPIPTKTQQTIPTDQSNNPDESSVSTNKQQIPSTTEVLSNDNNDRNNEVHILICGSPKVGKSTLINALCGCPVAKVKTIGLDHCTQKTSYYQLDNIYFWDTPGIQQWSNIDIDSYINSSKRCQTPLCMFYCASPGSFTKLKQLEMLLDECIYQRHIFCVLVVTNMFAHINRHAILNEFKTLLSKYIDHSQQIREEDGVFYYGHVGLCTMVNSREYVDEDTNRRQSQQGINELVMALTKSFSRTHQLDGWLRTIEKNTLFWLEKQEEIFRLTKKSDDICLSEIIQNI
ncbi:unnamed protein product [Rotaria sordida]|uniref:G domain-containing protein n=1 Tax=Rotaria sordida TaxID=392033 RepID=A0A814HEL2_9BILA|nr:unnamed protein product [Rotaria sordida]CAF1009770.1 unnamed protein product [Rotaria sordida]CAF1034968.1 unnamed protein product [Rotaria sordida]CAF1059260.1 unnamed protein product [Rotaria sordida]CAF1066886.1 unnamed protein product [Rotaria sordida]